MGPRKLRITTAKSVDSLKPRATRYAVPDTEVKGLDLRVFPDGLRVWSLRYYARGQRRRLKLGEYGPSRMSLAAARTAANRALRRVDDDKDPQAERRAAKEAAKAEKLARQLAQRDSIERLCEDFIERHAKPTKRTWRDDRSKINREILPVWKGRPVSSITRRDVRALVQAIADRPAPIYANRTAALLSRLFQFAVDEDLIQGNIAARLKKPKVEAGFRPGGRDATKPYTADEIRSIWQTTDRLEGRPQRALYRTLLLTGCRLAEIRDLRWDEIDGTWITLPAARVKSNKDHRVFLTPAALDELESVPRIDGQAHVFQGWRSKRAIADANKIIFRAVASRAKPIHALRSTVASGLAESGISIENIGRVLGHAVGAKVTAGYVAYRHDAEKATALSTWGRELARILANEPKQRAAVVPIR